MDHNSDNYVAELLLKGLGAEVGGAGTTAAGDAVVIRSLAAAGVPLAGVQIVDGSGLSLDDRLTARRRRLAAAAQLARPATCATSSGTRCRSPASRGTLQHRLLDGPAHGAVRAKTGHDRPRLRAVGLRERPLCVLDPAERRAGVVLLRPPGAGPGRAGARPRRGRNVGLASPSSGSASSASSSASVRTGTPAACGLLHLAARALAGEDRGRLLRHAVGDLRAERLERRGRLAPGEALERARDHVLAAGQRPLDGPVVLVGREASARARAARRRASGCPRRRTTRRSTRRGRGRSPRTP